MPRIANVVIVAAAIALGAPLAAQGNLDRALRNYQALMEGRIQLHQLTPVELEEVRLLDAARRGEQPPRLDNKSECRDRQKTSETPSTLEESILDLKCSQRPE